MTAKYSGVLWPLVVALASTSALAFAGEVSGPAQGVPDIDTEHIFGFAEGSDIGEKGEREIESVTIGSFGAGGIYNNVDNETSFRYGVTDQLRLSIGTLTDYYGIYNTPGLPNRSQADFSGLIGEMRVLLIDRLKAPFGLSLSINPQWRQFDPLSGVKTGNYAIPATLLIDKELIPEKLYAVSNLVYAPYFLRVNTYRGRDDAFTAIGGLSYALDSHIFLGGEVRHETLLQDGALIGHALFAGPNIFYRFSPVFSVKVAWSVQIPDIGASGLDLTSYQRHQVEFQAAYNF